MSTNVSPLQLSGLATGIDTGALIDALMFAERQPLEALTQKKRNAESEQALVKAINSLVSTLEDAASDLFTVGAFDSRSATSADAAVVTASASDSAALGTYNVTVSQLASAHTMQSGVSPALGAGDTLDLTVNGELTSYTFEATDDLASFAAKINADDAGVVSASVVSNRLVLISKESGSAGAITVGGSAAGALGMTQTQAAQDAAATVNGVAVTGSGNTISGAIGGLDLTLTGVGSTTLTVGSDTAAVEANVKTFVDAYNSLLGNLRTATSYDATTEVAGLLQGDSSFTGFLSQLRSTAGSSVPSLSGSAYDSLAQIGITAAKDGTLTLDSSKFQAAFAADPAGVEEVFAAADGIGQAVNTVIDNFTSAVIDPRLDGFTTQIGRFADQIDAMEDRLAVREERLRREWSAVEVAISQLQQQQSGLLQGLASIGVL